MTDSIGGRMKRYESVSKTRLTPKTPVLIRLDGKAFHTFTRGMERPYCRPFHECMWAAAKHLCENVQGCRLAYAQSDEITLLLVDYQTHQTRGWFDYEVQKMCSVAAAMCSVAFLDKYRDLSGGDPQLLPRTDALPAFDARCWNVPKEEVCNVFVWRQKDATRNAIQFLGQSKYGHETLHGRSCNQIQDALYLEHGVNFNDLPTPQKRGACVVKETYEHELSAAATSWSPGSEGLKVARTRWVVDENVPIFSADRAYVERHVYLDEAELALALRKATETHVDVEAGPAPRFVPRFVRDLVAAEELKALSHQCWGSESCAVCQRYADALMRYETCKACGKHVSQHYGGEEYRCEPAY